MGLLLRYVRTMLMRPRVDGQESGGDTREEEEELDKDLKLLLDSVEPVFQSRNPAVSVHVVQ
jgi:AP-3 complex subunit beta